MRLNCKQVIKLQQNRSTSPTATASLVRSLKSISVHYRHTRDWLCVCANGKTSAHLKYVFKMSTVCMKSNASSKTWTPLPDRFIDDQLVEMFPLFNQVRLQLVDVTNLAAVHTILQLPPNLVVDWVKVLWNLAILVSWRPGRNVTDFLLNCALQISLLKLN